MGTQRLSILVGVVALSLCSLVAQGEFRLAQTKSEAGPLKLDEYGDLPTDDEAARLDLFADKLFKQRRLSGRIIAYCESQMERGLYLRRIHGIAKYLTYARGIEANRVAVIDGGYREQFVTELWLIPEGSNPPVPVPKSPQPSVSISSAYKFDEECLDCATAVDLYLYGLDEGLQFYAEALRRYPAARGLLIVRPDHDVSIRRALNEAHKAKGLLIKNYGIDADRVIVRSARSRKDGTAVVEMWVVPSGATFPTTTSNKRLQRTRLIAPAIER
jgi:hypothetical protein